MPWEVKEFQTQAVDKIDDIARWWEETSLLEEKYIAPGIALGIAPQHLQSGRTRKVVQDLNRNGHNV